MFKNLAAKFAEEGKTNFEFLEISEPISQEHIDALVENTDSMKKYFAEMLIRHEPTAVGTAQSIGNSYVDLYWLRETEGLVAMALYFLSIDEDNWFSTEAIINMLRQSQVRRQSEHAIIFRGADLSDLKPDCCKPKGQLLCTLNQDAHTATIFVPLLRD